MSLKEALKSVTQADIDELNEQIREHEKEIAQLKEVRRLIEVKLGIRRPLGSHLKGTQKRHKQQEAEELGQGNLRSASSEKILSFTEEYRQKVRLFLMANGPQKQVVLWKRCGIPEGSIDNVIKHRWFTVTSRGVELTAKGNAGT